MTQPGTSVWTKTQLAVFFVMILLSLDEINPVKIFLQVFPSVSAWHVAVSAAVIMSYIVVTDIKNLLYSAVKIFLHSILSIFFRQVEIVGRDNVPIRGPVLFTVNHANQFMDAAMAICTCQRQVSYLMAEASWKRRIVGDLAWALDVVPVKRAQDDARKGTGRITMQLESAKAKESAPTLKITGHDTLFTKELAVGDKVRPPKTAFAVKITSVESDTSLTADADGLPDDFPLNNDEPVPFDYMKRTPLNVVFARVLDKLNAGGACGIFPEGGSHDRTDLLPLKVGISLIAYSALEKDGLNVPIVPVGLNYFRAHRWRGRAVVEFGRPIFIDPTTLADFKKGGAARKKVCNRHLEDIESSMRSVIVSAPDFETLELIHTARRLYRKGRLASSFERQDLSRRFAEGYKRLLLMTNGNPPQEWLALQERIKSYRNELKDLGLKDYQVPALQGEHFDDVVDIEHVDGDKVLSVIQLLYHIVHLVIIMLIAAVPTLLLNLPVGILAGIYSERRRKKALARSKVKVKAYDVMLTEKIIFCIVMVPTLWFVYGILLVSCTELERPAIALIMLTMPLFSYAGIVVAEAGMVDWKDLRPYLMRLSPSARSRLAALPATRKELQEDLRAFIRKIGPALGEIYYGKDLDWKAIQESSRVDDSKKAK